MMSLKKIRQQAMNLSKAKGDKSKKIFIRIKMQELNCEMAMHGRRKDEFAKSLMKKVRKIKDPIQRREVQSMWQAFERVLDKKDHQIQYTMKMMIIASDQLLYTVEYHCSAMDKMINNYFSELDSLAKENKKRINKCVQSGKEFDKHISLDQEVAETHLKLLLFDAKSRAEYLNWTQKGIHIIREKDERLTYARERAIMPQYFVRIFSSMWDEYKSVFSTYVNNNAEIKKELYRLREKDKVLTDIIATQAKELQQSDALVRRLRAELLALEFAQDTKHQDRIDKYRDACKRLKTMISKDCELDDKQIKYLVVEVSGAMDWLEAAYKKGEKILNLAAVCRKYETQKEKVLPFPNTTPQDSIYELESPTFLRKTLAETCGLIPLWQKISNAKLTNFALFKEKHLLEYENAIFNRKIQANVNITKIKKCVCAHENSVHSIDMEGVLEVHKFTKEVHTSI